MMQREQQLEHVKELVIFCFHSNFTFFVVWSKYKHGKGEGGICPKEMTIPYLGLFLPLKTFYLLQDFPHT